MLINPIVAIASVAAVRAVGTLLGQTASPTNQYFDTMIEDNFMSHPSPAVDIKDAVILNREQEQQPTRVKPPPLPDTNNPLMLLGLDKNVNDFKTIKAAYKSRAKQYHPDIILSADASQEERISANWDFARINSAFDILKRKEEEQVYEYEVYVDGKKEKRSATPLDDNRNPYHINYDRILQNRKRYPQERMWYQDDGYEPNHSYRRPRHYDPEPFGDHDGKYSVDAFTKGKWWIAKGYHDHAGVHYVPLTDVDYGPMKSSEQRWEERQQTESYNAGAGRGRQSSARFGVVDPYEDQWWHDRSTSSNTPLSTNHENYQRDNHCAGEETREGYPYKDMYWNRQDNEAASSYQPTADYDPQDERFVVREKWWRADETVNGEFSP